MGKYEPLNPKFRPDPLAAEHASRAWSLLTDGFACEEPYPIEEGMTPAQAAEFHLMQALERVRLREIRGRLQPRKPTLAEIAVAEDRPAESMA